MATPTTVPHDITKYLCWCGPMNIINQPVACQHIAPITIASLDEEDMYMYTYMYVQ